MITQEQIPKVLGHPVHDREGVKIGDAQHVFVDDATGMPDWVSVRTGLFGMNESFVPLRDASLVQDHLEVPFAKTTVKEAPNADIDAGGHLSAQEERRLYRHYGMTWESGEQRRPGGTPAGTAGTTGQQAAAGTAATAGTAEDTAMTRSEEEMHVGVEQRATGKARLHKYVVTEQVQQTVPVRHEEVRIEREPITDENREQAMRGPEISEGDFEVTLHEERPVVETEVVPKERVRMTTDEVTEEETVRGQVRKERIQTDTGQPGREQGDESQR